VFIFWARLIIKIKNIPNGVEYSDKCIRLEYVEKCSSIMKEIGIPVILE
jgi:hypothetical protein